ncbi:hypothetical protein [Hubei virga-like virus 7]|uniref:hypothetical protein n=1 Tax=Hubei virga-like virus 7 TaxID=1923340 RepID=UPI0009097065|nr:hypothetical protein [Hubei virga-like virus 7]APG77672.1 hypothetical protein [Hubei virga-like virus 7]
MLYLIVISALFCISSTQFVASNFELSLGEIAELTDGNVVFQHEFDILDKHLSSEVQIYSTNFYSHIVGANCPVGFHRQDINHYTFSDIFACIYHGYTDIYSLPVKYRAYSLRLTSNVIDRYSTIQYINLHEFLVLKNDTGYYLSTRFCFNEYPWKDINGTIQPHLYFENHDTFVKFYVSNSCLLRYLTTDAEHLTYYIFSQIPSLFDLEVKTPNSAVDFFRVGFVKYHWLHHTLSPGDLPYMDYNATHSITKHCYSVEYCVAVYYPVQRLFTTIAIQSAHANSFVHSLTHAILSILKPILVEILSLMSFLFGSIIDLIFSSEFIDLYKLFFDNFIKALHQILTFIFTNFRLLIYYLLTNHIYFSMGLFLFLLIYIRYGMLVYSFIFVLLLSSLVRLD